MDRASPFDLEGGCRASRYTNRVYKVWWSRNRALSGVMNGRHHA